MYRGVARVHDKGLAQQFHGTFRPVRLNFKDPQQMQCAHVPRKHLQNTLVMHARLVQVAKSM